MSSFVIVAHGAPSSPDAPEAALSALADDVRRHAPELKVRSATLAKPGALAQALEGLEAPKIYPFFMARGWFVGRELPRRLAQIGAEAEILSPFGLDPNLPAHIAQWLSDELATTGLTQVILAAHGSKVARNSKDSAYDMAETLRRSFGFAELHVGLIEEAPYLADVARAHPHALCLPFFALRAGHVETDIPQALASAGFAGKLLPSVGESAHAAPIIATALRRA